METQPSGAVENQVLLEGLRRREGRAVEAIYLRHARPILAYAVRFLRSREEADDVLQETFATAIEKASAFRGESPLSTWLFGIARRKCLERIRARGRSKPMEAPEMESALPRASGLSEPERNLDRKLAAERIERALGALPDDLREPLLLRDVEGLDYEEAAAVLGIPLGTLKSRLARARWALRALLLAGPVPQ